MVHVEKGPAEPSAAGGDAPRQLAVLRALLQSAKEAAGQVAVKNTFLTVVEPGPPLPARSSSLPPPERRPQRQRAEDGPPGCSEASPAASVSGFSAESSTEADSESSKSEERAGPLPAPPPLELGTAWQRTPLNAGARAWHPCWQGRRTDFTPIYEPVAQVSSSEVKRDASAVLAALKGALDANRFTAGTRVAWQQKEWKAAAASVTVHLQRSCTDKGAASALEAAKAALLGVVEQCGFTIVAGQCQRLPFQDAAGRGFAVELRLASGQPLVINLQLKGGSMVA